MASITGGNLSYIGITGTAKVTAKGGYLTNPQDDLPCYGTGAGIGGGGIYNSYATTVAGGCLTNGVISTSGTITATGGYSACNSYGTGAGIGGGGIYTTQTGTTGGNLTNITVSNGNITAKGGYSSSDSSSYTAKGTGAGFGGGGILSTASDSTIVGGKLTEGSITGGDVKGIAGYGETPYGTGAGIGGGGVASIATASSITKGEMGRLSVDDLNLVTGTQASTSYGAGAEIGDGGVYNYNSGENTSSDGEDFIDGEAPRVTRAWRNASWTGFKVIATDNKALNKITKTNDREVTYAELSGTECTASVGLTSGTIASFDVVDMFNNSVTVANFELDSSVPQASVSYSEGTYTITASDEGAGLWKITDPSGNEINTWANYPSSDTYTASGPINMASATVHNGVNNIATVTLDNGAPEVSVSRGSTTCTITATDTVSGLWKIEQIATDGSVVVTTAFDTAYDKTPNTTKTVDINGATVKFRVYDGAGNYTEFGVPLEVSGTAEVSSSEKMGIKVTGDCTLTFSGSSAITIGDKNIVSAGIEIADGASLTIINTNTNVDGVKIYGGNREDSYGSVIKCAGIYVPVGSTLNMQGTGKTYAYGYQYGNGTGAGIGGNGIAIASASTSQASNSAGSINISGGTVYAYGGYESEEKCGTGAGIGTGGIYNGTSLATLTGGSVSSVKITGGTVYAYGGYANGEGAVATGAGKGRPEFRAFCRLFRARAAPAGTHRRIPPAGR